MRASSGVAVGRRDQFERRVGEREHLLQAVEFVHEPQARIDVDKRLEPRKRRDGDVIRNDFSQPVEIDAGHEMVEHVDHHVGSWLGRVVL